MKNPTTRHAMTIETVGRAAARGRLGPRSGRGKWARLLVCAGLIAGQAFAVASAAPVAYPDDMLCGAELPRPDRGAALAEQVAQTPHGAIGYYRFGQGSPIVLITGYRATVAEWNAYFLGELAKDHEVIVFDNRGIGQSRADGTRYGIEDLAGDTAALIDALNLKGATVVGWSMGGMVAQQLAIDHPKLVGKLVLMSSMPPGPRAVPVAGRVERVLSGSGSGHFGRVMDVLFPADVAQQAKQCFIGDMFAPRGYAEPRIPAAVTQAQDALIARWTRDGDALAELRRVAVPTLVLAGTDDTVLPLRNSVVLGETLPHATLVEVDGAGHAMMYQYPRQLAERIGAFIAE
jgi:pimeloyl-ACP methyl ester carboxylesterase